MLQRSENWRSWLVIFVNVGRW